jgi:hypothetical protein
MKNVTPVERWDHAFWCLNAAFLWFGGLLPQTRLGVWIPPWWMPGDPFPNGRQSTALRRGK